VTATSQSIAASRQAKPCRHASEAVPVCDYCARHRAQMLAWRKLNENRGHQDYGVVQLTWAAPQIGGGNV
jgi:hypothetical protein